MRPGVDVDARLGARLRAGAGVGLDRPSGSPRNGACLGRRGELRGELAEGQVLAAARGSGRRWRRPRTRWRRRCRAPPRSPRAARTARQTPSRTRPTRFFTGAWRWEVPSSDAPVAASASSASARTLEGPAPKRPSAGLRSAGMVIASVTVGPPRASREGDLTSLSAVPLFCHPHRRGTREQGTHDEQRARRLVLRRPRPVHRPATPRRWSAEVQAEYVVRYGGPDDTPMEAGALRPAARARSSSGTATRCRWPWAAGAGGRRAPRSGGARRPRSSGCTSRPRRAAAGSRGRARAPRGDRPGRRRRRDGAGDRDDAAGGDRAVHAAGYERIADFGHYSWSPLVALLRQAALTVSTSMGQWGPGARASGCRR